MPFKDRWSVPRLLAPELKVHGKLEVDPGEELPSRSPKSASPHRILGLHVEVDGLAVDKVPYPAKAQTHRNVFNPGAGVEDEQTRASKIQSMVEVVVDKRLEGRLLRDRPCAFTESVLIGEESAQKSPLCGIDRNPSDTGLPFLSAEVGVGFGWQHHERSGSVRRPMQLDRGQVVELQAAEPGLRTARRVRIGDDGKDDVKEVLNAEYSDRHDVALQPIASAASPEPRDRRHPIILCFDCELGSRRIIRRIRRSRPVFAGRH
jgi:hypothetical protein